MTFDYAVVTLFDGPFQILRLTMSFLLGCRQKQPKTSHNPIHATLCRLTHVWFRLFRVRSPLLAESLLFSLPGGTEMFHFPPFAPIDYGFTYG